MGRCALLEDLPTEIRLRIYEFVFDGSYQSSLLIRSNSKIELVSLAKAHGALLKTCRTIHAEALPILYDATTFRVQIYPVEGYSSHGNMNKLHTSAPFLRRMRHVEVNSCIILPIHIEPALRLMKSFAYALEQVGASIKTMRVRSRLFNEMPENQLNEYREKLVQQEESRVREGNSQLFQKMVNAANNGDGMVAIDLCDR